MDSRNLGRSCLCSNQAALFLVAWAGLIPLIWTLAGSSLARGSTNEVLGDKKHLATNQSLLKAKAPLSGTAKGGDSPKGPRPLESALAPERGFEVQVAWTPSEESAKAFQGTGPGACYNEAYRVLTRDEALLLCTQTSSLDTARCFVSAVETLSKEAALKLCQGSSTRAGLECYRESQRILPGESALALCAHGGDNHTPQCFTDASRSLSTQQALKLCSGGVGARERFFCFEQATVRFGVEFALEYCVARS